MSATINKVLLGLILIVVGLGVAKWLQNKEQSGTDEIQTGSNSSLPESATPAVDKAQQQSASDTSSSFNRSDSIKVPPQTDAAAQPTDSAPNSGATSETKQTGAGTSKPANSPSQVHIEVPQSYPVEQAAEFFIPAEQRSPGNLGGPPPPPAALLKGLSAPPAAPSVGGLQPPAAPN